MRFSLQLYFTTILTILFTTIGLSQTGKIAGRVMDGSGKEPLPFVNVIVQGTSLGAASDINGYYSIIGLAPGTYTVKASSIGYITSAVTNVRVSIDLTTQIDFKLEQTSIQVGKEIVVVAQRPLIQKDLTASTAIIDSKEISALPVTEFQDLLQLKAGYVGGSVRGGRSGEVVYAIDGVPVTDVYDGSNVVDVSTSSIQELQFVSGAFNAEYGRALSGYVNIATKDGDNKLQGNITTYIGGHLSSHSNIFPDIKSIRPLSIRDLEGSLSGPIIRDKLFFYANIRYIYFGGWIYGQDVYNPWNITINQGPTLPVAQRYILSAITKGDTSGVGSGAIVPMNYNERFNSQFKFTLKPFEGVKLDYVYILDNVNYRDISNNDMSFTFDPYGDFRKFTTGNTNILSLTHTLSSSTFYQASLSYFFKEFQQYVYKNPSDPRYTNTQLFSLTPTEVPSFKTGGTQNTMFRRTTGTYGFKVDMTSQVDRINQVKTGVEYNLYNLTFNNVTLLQPNNLQDPTVSLNPFAPMHVPNPNDPNENLYIDLYTRRPTALSAYIQDKIELKDLIINVGVRGDYFNPDGQLLNDPSDPDIYHPLKPSNVAQTMAQRLAHWYHKAPTSFQLSPRLGVAFPITDRGVVHFSFGEFFQIPDFQWLYVNPDYKFGSGSGSGNTGTGNLGIAGNPGLQPEQTTSGEVGVSQALSDDITFDLTGYFRDISNLAGTTPNQIYLFGGAATYSQYANSDFGFVKGIILSVTKRMSDNWSATIDYTLQSAKGNESDPNAVRNDLVSGIQPEIQILPLNWDQTNTINATFNYASDAQWGFSLIGSYGSGFPYSPTQSQNVSSILINTGLKPSTINVDLRAYKDFMIDKMRLNLFLRVYNLFDTENQLNVYNDSGTANFTIAEYLDRINGNPTKLVNTLDQYFRNPSYYSEPRRVEIGASIFF